MANPLMLKITVDDEGNPVLEGMQSNIKKLDSATSGLGKTLTHVFASTIMWQGIAQFRAAVGDATREVFEFVQIDKEIQEAVEESGVKNGFVLLRSPHNTATITCNEPDPSIYQDAKRIMEKLLPEDFDWQHSYEGAVNARAHQAVMLLFGQTHWLPIKNSKIVIGTWQGIFLVELFEGRNRRVEMVIVGE